MQTTLLKRDTFAKLGTGKFQPPFPDHYALNSMLINAGKWVFSPEKLLVVGISPKSFGHYVYSNKQSGGLAYLGITTDFDGWLPGSELTNGMHVWLNMLLRDFPGALAGVRVDRAGYVRRQIYAWFMQQRLGGITLREFAARFSLLGVADWAGLLASIVDKASWDRLLHVLKSGRKSAVETQIHGLHSLQGARDIRQFAQWLAERKAGRP